MSPTTAVLLIAHGSPVQAANEDLLHVVRGLQERDLGSIIEPAFLEGAVPDIPEGIGRCVSQGVSRILIIPYFLLAGRHVAEDLPAFVEAARVRYPHVEFVMGDLIGGHTLLTEILLDRIMESGFLPEDEGLPDL